MALAQERTQVAAAIYADHEWDSVALVGRRRWRVALSNGGRRFTASRREAIEWCEEMGLPYTVVASNGSYR